MITTAHEHSFIPRLHVTRSAQINLEQAKILCAEISAT
jgi:hypothetical protein